ncbi:MAG: tetratricopeptide repeat protein [Alphaproteobacteria bacterium]|nr:tetratricopeptide repeat protein [Alphaproteobacteria bacterium]
MNSLINQINSLIQHRQLGEAAVLCDQFIAAYPENATGWFRLGQIRQMNCDFDGMLDCARQVIAKMADSPAGYLQEIDALIHGGRADEAVLKIAAQEERSKDDVQTLNQLADFYTHAGQFEAAGRCYQRTRVLWPTEPKVLYNCAASAIALGKLDEAEDLFNQVLDTDPHDYDAYYNRATLRKQTANNNHIEELLSCIKDGIRNPAGEVQVYYALAKEYEDIGEHGKSFASLRPKARTGVTVCCVMMWPRMWMPWRLLRIACQVTSLGTALPWMTNRARFLSWDCPEAAPLCWTGSYPPIARWTVWAKSMILPCL